MILQIIQNKININKKTRIKCQGKKIKKADLKF